MAGIVCAQFTFYNDFDSANLARVEFVPPSESVIIKQPTNKPLVQEIYDAEFNIWTRPDCYGTQYENGNRTWFYFGMKAPLPLLYVRFNMVDLNRQGKMYSQGMAPVFRILPGKPKWERIFDKPVYSIQNDIFTLTFKFRTPENPDNVMYFAFTYPFSYLELEKMLVNIDSKYLTMQPLCEDDIYYTREVVNHSIEGRAVHLITISSYHGITLEREERLRNLFPNTKVPRPHKFVGKKVIFVSARVHPGETPSSFVFNGILNLLLTRDDLIAQHLRKLYVFKMIPFLNPDGVARGHYRTDNRGVNLNRVYLNPSSTDHPSVYAARALIRYYHYGFEKDDVVPKCENCNVGNVTDSSMTEDEENVQNDNISKKVSHMSLEEGDAPSSPWCTKCKNNIQKLEDTMPGISSIIPTFTLNTSIGHNFCRNCGAELQHTQSKEEIQFENVVIGAHGDVNSNESGLFLYMDLHGHASKKGVFIYGNHFDDMERNVECMLLPKLMSINNHNFHFNACNFTERNMYLRDKRDGMSRAGSGRVAVLSLTGIIKSYTLECNYNTGRLVNVLPPTTKESNGRVHTLPVPPKYNPLVFEEVGKSLGASILDMTGQNPCSRLPNSEFHSLSGLREWLRTMSCEVRGEDRPKMKGRTSAGLQSQGKSTRGVVIKNRPPAAKTVTKKSHIKPRSASIPLERKENLIMPSSSKSVIRLTKSFKAKSRKELTLKSKNIASDKITKPTINRIKKTTNVTPQKVRLDITSKLKTIRENLDIQKVDSDSIHLQEICFIKNSEGKTVIAKYKNKDNTEFNDNLVVSWDASTSKPQIFTQKTRISSAPAYGSPINCLSEPGPSKQGAFRIHNFSKNVSSKTKLKKVSLRRLASATDVLGKVDKKKKKKLKAK